MLANNIRESRNIDRWLGGFDSQDGTTAKASICRVGSPEFRASHSASLDWSDWGATYASLQPYGIPYRAIRSLRFNGLVLLIKSTTFTPKA